jgi:lipopolysaccharide export system protein LptC
MSERRRRYPALLFLAAITVIAAISFWALEMTRRSGNDAKDQTQRTQPDYYVENFDYVKIGADSNPKIRMRGAKLIHHPQNDSSTVLQPLVVSYSEQRPPMTLRSDRLIVNGDRSQLHFYDNVRMEKPQARGNDTLIVESQHLLAMPNRDLVTTTQKATLTLGHSTLSGVGMIADNAHQTLSFQSEVQGSFTSTAKR